MSDGAELALEGVDRIIDKWHDPLYDKARSAKQKRREQKHGRSSGSVDSGERRKHRSTASSGGNGGSKSRHADDPYNEADDEDLDDRTPKRASSVDRDYYGRSDHRAGSRQGSQTSGPDQHHRSSRHRHDDEDDYGRGSSGHHSHSRHASRDDDYDAHRSGSHHHSSSREPHHSSSRDPHHSSSRDPHHSTSRSSRHDSGGSRYEEPRSYNGPSASNRGPSVTGAPLQHTRSAAAAKYTPSDQVSQPPQRPLPPHARGPGESFHRPALGQ